MQQRIADLIVELLALECAEQRIIDILRVGIDSSAFYATCARWKIAPYIHYRIEGTAMADHFPDELRTRLAAAYRWGVLLRMEQRQGTIQILDRLADKGVPSMLLKGSSFVDRVLPDPNARWMSDFDVLIPRDRVPEVEAELREAGWRIREPDQRWGWYEIEDEYQAVYLAPNGRAALDLHRHIVRPPLSAAIDIEDFWQRSQPMSFEGRSTRIADPCDQLFHVCVHLAASNDFIGGMRSLLDVSLLVAASTPGLDWDQLILRSRRAGLTTLVGHALEAARCLLHAPVPPSVLQAMVTRDASTLETRWRTRLVRRCLLNVAEHPRWPDWLAAIVCTQLMRNVSWLERTRGVLLCTRTHFRESAQQAQPGIDRPLSPHRLAQHVSRRLARWLNRLSHDEA